MLKKDLRVNGSKSLIPGFTFKENCLDVRNTRVINIYEGLLEYGFEVDVFDSRADEVKVDQNFGIKVRKELELNLFESYTSVILTVAYKQFSTIPLHTNSQQVIFDLKVLSPKSSVDGRL